VIVFQKWAMRPGCLVPDYKVCRKTTSRWLWLKESSL